LLLTEGQTLCRKAKAQQQLSNTVNQKTDDDRLDGFIDSMLKRDGVQLTVSDIVTATEEVLQIDPSQGIWRKTAVKRGNVV